MKKLFLQFIVTALTLVVTDYLIPGVEIRNSIDGLLLVTVMFTAINVIIKPLLKVLSLPIEVATLGTFSVIINTVLLLMVDYILTPLGITSFWFPGITYGPIIIAPMRVPAFSYCGGSIITDKRYLFVAYLVNQVAAQMTQRNLIDTIHPCQQ